MLWIRIGCELVIDIIIFDRIDKILNQHSVNGVSDEVITRVVLRYYLTFGLRVILVASATYKLTDLIDII